MNENRNEEENLINDCEESKKMPRKATVFVPNSKSRTLNKKLIKYNLLSALVGKAKKKINNVPKKVITDEVDDGTSCKSLNFHTDGEIEMHGKLLSIDSNSTLNNDGPTIDNLILTSFINFEHPFFTEKLSNACHILQQTLRNLSDGETHFTKILTNYIKDAKFQKELVDTLSNQYKLRLEAESLSNTLANDMWMEQMETERSRCESLQDALTILVKQNRQLQIDKEMVHRKLEETTFCSNNDTGTNYKSQVGDLLVHNNHLQTAVENYAQQIDKLENNLRTLEIEKINIDELLKNAIVEIQKLNSKIQRIKIDYELKIATLESKLHKDEEHLKNVAGEVANEMNKFKNQLELSLNSTSISWNHFKSENNSVTQLLNVCKAFINQMAEEFLSVNRKLHSKDEDISRLIQDNLKLQDDLKKYTFNSGNDVEKSVFSNEINENEIKNLRETLRQYEALNSLLLERQGDKNLYCKENQSTDNFEQKQFENVVKEKQYLKTELDILKRDNQILLDTKLDWERKQNQELEKLYYENGFLKQQLDAERKTVYSLQNERMKYLDEKNLIKVMFEHMKHELNRLQTLEGTFVNVTKEANKLAMIAEHNKQVGEELKCKIVEKENTIQKLTSNMDKLNIMQIQNTREKMNLFNELSQISNTKDWLKNVLNVEMQKCKNLDISKKEVLNSATTQIKQYFQLQKNEKAAIMDLLKDYKCIVDEKKQLSSDNKILHQRIEEYKTKINEFTQKYDENCCKINEQNVKIGQLTNKQCENEQFIAKLEKQLSENEFNYNKRSAESELTINQLKKDKEDLNDTVKYLQNNLNKLHDELNNAREEEKEARNTIKDLIKDKNELIPLKMKIESLTDEKAKLSREIDNFNTMCEKILNDYEITIKSNIEKEEKFKKEIEVYNIKINNYKVSLELLQNTNNKIVVEKQELFENYNNLLHKVKQVEEQTIAINDQNLLIQTLSKEKTEMETQLRQLQYKYDEYKSKVEITESENNQLKLDLQRLGIQNENNTIEYEKKIKEINVTHENDVNVMKNELKQLNCQLNDSLRKLENERNSYNTLTQIYKDVAKKFSISIKQLDEEKNRRQELMMELEQTVTMIANLKIEKKNLKQEIYLYKLQLNQFPDKSEDKLNPVNTMDETCQTELNNNSEKTVNETKTTNLNEKDEVISHLNRELCRLEADITGLQFEKSEITLKLHEIQGMLETERYLTEQLKNRQRLTLSMILQMKDESKIDPIGCNHLMLMMRSDLNSIQHGSETVLELLKTRSAGSL